MFQTLKDAPQFSYHPKCVKLHLTHLIFADDLLVFVRGDLPSVVAVKNCLSLFSRYYGLTPNVSKTNIYFAGIRSDVQAMILSETGFVVGSFPFKYLGTPLHSSRLTADLFLPLMAKIKGRLGDWASLQLSYAGRIQLINTAIFGVEAFWCACLLLPRGVVRNLEKTCRQFFWGTESKRRMIFYSWDKVCRSRDQGGFDIREILSWNKTLMLKVFWSFSYHCTSIWMNWSKEFVFKRLSCWELAASFCVSPIWQKILYIRDEFLDKVGSRGKVQALFQDWNAAGRLPLKDIYQIFRGSHNVLKWLTPLTDSIVIPKHVVVATLVSQQALATVDNICKRGILFANRCVLCCSAAESSQHLFFQCPFSKHLMQQVLAWMGVTRGVLSLKHELYKIALCRGTRWRRKAACCSLAAVVYYIWQERNRRVFDGGCLRADQLMRKLI
ncbi:uncharacterized protein LOC141614323 [Silene latifolia]|uniref:uncharacterized protein LOC141614323 n=1 Tax=Silene latifolia TaxID=37657 RepID=UPI003D7749BF